ncbi:hypothetical protein GQ55_1G125600 [Panicum hallii var. hallii]|uniref:F-box/LRR-repeat protein 15/At3g58940/PEG3-like LRR domain-containing protein n=1 Tax=Panicum hallii var. hallii TaxID=1504633 RepID=A0A2T7F4X7_9POAL|nr:hypothetical protein GQ55_1G125600 [Panicum hallii var. hallii]
MSLLWSSHRASSACRLILWQEYPCMPNSFFSTRVRISYTTVLKVLGSLEPAIHQLQIGGTVIESRWWPDLSAGESTRNSRTRSVAVRAASQRGSGSPGAGGGKPRKRAPLWPRRPGLRQRASRR